MTSHYSQLCDVYFGRGAITEAGSLASRAGFSRVLVVTDKGVDNTGAPDRAIDSLRAKGIECLKYADVEMDAPDYCVNEGGRIAKEFNADAVVAVGGGSCLDAAKAISLVASNLPGFKIQDVFDCAPGSYKLNPPLKNMMIPTTSGTGSESTFVAVVSDTTKHRKCGCFISPQISIIDPELTLGLNAKITAYTAMDAFSHSSEALASKGMNPHSDLLAIDAIRRIVKWAPVAVKEPNNIEARENLAIASNFAGKAFNDSSVNIGHAMAHSLGAMFHIPHGVACALVTPAVLERTASSRPEQFRTVLGYFGVEAPKNDSDINSVLADAVRTFIRKLGIPSLKALGLSREQAVSCAAYARTEGMRFACLVDIPDDSIEGMFGRVYDCYQ